MSGKSRHGKGKHGKRKKSRQHFSAVSARQTPVAQTNEPIVVAKPSALPASVLTPIKTQTATRYPYITAELRRIGILAGIMLAILVVLALVLPYLS